MDSNSLQCVTSTIHERCYTHIQQTFFLSIPHSIQKYRVELEKIELMYSWSNCNRSSISNNGRLYLLRFSVCLYVSIVFNWFLVLHSASTHEESIPSHNLLENVLLHILLDLYYTHSLNQSGYAFRASIFMNSILPHSAIYYQTNSYISHQVKEFIMSALCLYHGQHELMPAWWPKSI